MCNKYREALSAWLDGEDPGIPQAEVDRHVAGCSQCAAWLDAASYVTRRARIAPVEMVPDLTGRVLRAAVPASFSRSGWCRPQVLVGLRLALFVVAVGQAAVSLSGLAANSESGMGVLHTMHEAGAWNAALAVGFGWVAWRVRRAAGLLPLLFAFVLILAVTTVQDLFFENTHVHWELDHLLVVAGFILVALLARGWDNSGDPHAGGDVLPVPGLRLLSQNWPRQADAVDGVQAEGGTPAARHRDAA